MELGNHIKELRKQKGLRQEQLAEAMGVSTTSVSKWETNQTFPELTLLAELADLVHMTPNYFCNYFKKQTGLTPFTQLNNIRVRRASKMLRNTEKSIAEIAEACGYENVSFFIRKFKEIRGCTPSVYRRKG